LCWLLRTIIGGLVHVRVLFRIHLKFKSN
jgi:hypothetical protein